MTKTTNHSWTKKQEKFLDLNKTGKFVVKACPGSGKTTAVTERVYKFIKNWNNKKSGIAVLSFTNIAADEIKEKLEKKERNLEIGYPHFIGTLDSFFNTYIFLPYGHLVMNCEKRPILVGDPVSHWSSGDYIENYFDRVKFSIDGEVEYKNKRLDYAEIKQMKYRLTREGFATQNDANYHAMKVLERYPHIAKALSIRFPHMIIDEAQDTSDIQMRIMDLLVENGLDNLILVGDPEQSIYEWKGGKPELFNEKYEKWKKNSIIFDDNFRSSQKICDFFSKLSDINTINSKCNHSTNIPPKIIPYKTNYKHIIDEFKEECIKNRIKLNEKNVSILFRGNKEVKKYKKSLKINDVPNLFEFYSDSKSRTVNIIEGLFHWNNENHLEGFQIMEKEYLKLKYRTNKITNLDIFEEIKVQGFQNHRLNVYNFINVFPPIENNQTINSWINKVNYKFKDYFRLSEVKNDIMYNTNYHSREVTFDLLFNEDSENNLDYHIGTVHSVKGGSFDATLLVLKEETEHNEKYSEIIPDNINLNKNPELRVIYVALSRAKKLLYLAVPQKDYKMWKSIFYNN